MKKYLLAACAALALTSSADAGTPQLKARMVK